MKTILQHIEDMRRDLEVVEDLHGMFSHPISRQPTVMDFINWSDKHCHKWNVDDGEPIGPWAYRMEHGHKFIQAIVDGHQVEPLFLIRKILEEYSFDLDHARFFFGKGHGQVFGGNAFFAAVPVMTNLGEENPYTLIFQVGLHYKGVGVMLVAAKVETLIRAEYLPWTQVWQEGNHTRLAAIVLINPDELNGPDGKGTKHPFADLTVRHEFFDVLRNYRFVQDLYGIPGIGSIRFPKAPHTKFMGAFSRKSCIPPTP